MNLCFKNMGIIHTSARESWITRLWEKLIKIHVWINCVRPKECSIWRFWESNFQFPFSGGACPRTPLPPYIIRAFGADIQSARFSPVTWSLMFSYRKTPYLYKTNDDTAKIIKSIGDQKSRESLIRKKNSCKNNESLRQKRQELWISRFKWFRFYPW